MSAPFINSGTELDFKAAFQALTGFAPMNWQSRLFHHLVKGEVPDACDLPTGLGKTSVIPIWLIALISQNGAERCPRLPRRLVYIVNRRTVVDQATTVVEQMRKRLHAPQAFQGHEKVLAQLQSQMKKMFGTQADEACLGVSTLRGELADNEEWKTNPAWPVIVIGTIDMVGSKLLFSGYGDGLYNRVHHAGLIGQDALIVHDEAHLTPAFQHRLKKIEEAQKQSGEMRPVRVMALSATTRGSQDSLFSLEQSDRKEPIVCTRLDAEKRLFLHEVEKEKFIEVIAQKALCHRDKNAKTLIYVQTPEVAQAVAKVLKKERVEDQQVALLTGTMRGHERDILARKNPVYQAMLNPERIVENTVFLISTSAGEVGIDLDADHLVCDLTTLDSFIQRLGRVNRRGGQGRVARVDVVSAPIAGSKKGTPSEFDQAITRALEILKQWVANANGEGLNVSPGQMRELVCALKEEEREAAFSPKPKTRPLTDIELDALALTSVGEMPGRPPIAPLLHGLTNDSPETFVAWRKEISLLREFEVQENELVEWFRACPVLSRERLRDRTDRIKKTLEGFLQTHRQQNENKDFPVVVMDEWGNTQWSTLANISEKDAKLAYRTVVLPVEVAGLDKHGMMDKQMATPPEEHFLDVAEEGPPEARRERWLRKVSAEGENWTRLLTGETSDLPPAQLKEKLGIQKMSGTEIENADEPIEELVLFVSARQSAQENPETASAEQTLEKHSSDITQQMTVIASQLELPPSLQEALKIAAKWHDKGKDRKVWQRFARNEDDGRTLAKANKYLHPRALGGYRHELGSLLDAMRDGEIQKHSERDLILHLIASHHGWARPHFEPRSFDPNHTTDENRQVIVATMQRFGRLQQRFGRWGLAWLESLLRAADIAASKAAVSSSIEEKE